MTKRPLHSAHGNIHLVIIVGLFIITVLLGTVLLMQRQEFADLRKDLAMGLYSGEYATTSNTNAQDQKSVYKNQALHFQLIKPDDTEVSVSMETVAAIRQEYGRIGKVIIGEGTEGIEAQRVVVHVYSNKAALEKDFTSSGSVLGGLGLSKTSKVISGKTSVVYFGDDVIEGVGDTAHAYVAAEVIGPTYAYMVEFYGMSADPNNAIIAEVLASFQVN